MKASELLMVPDNGNKYELEVIFLLGAIFPSLIFVEISVVVFELASD